MGLAQTVAGTYHARIVARSGSVVDPSADSQCSSTGFVLVRSPSLSDAMTSRSRSAIAADPANAVMAAPIAVTDLREPEFLQVLIYWHECRKEKPMPSRSDIDPMRIHRILNKVLLIDVAVSASSGRLTATIPPKAEIASAL